METYFKDFQIDLENMKKELKDRIKYNQNLESQIEHYALKEIEFQKAIKKIKSEKEMKNKEIKLLEGIFSNLRKERDIKSSIINNLELQKKTLEKQVSNLKGDLLDNKNASNILKKN